MAKILVVDDEKSIRVTVGEFLKSAGHDVRIAADVEQAESILLQETPDVVVADIILPRVSGVELLKKIGDLAPQVPVIMMTGEPTIETAAEAVRAGAFDYLAKPISKDAIMKTVARAVDLKELRDERVRLEKENRQYREGLERLVQERTDALLESEEKFRHVQKMEAIGKLAGGVAHDFNNILMVIAGAADFIAKIPELQEEAQEDVLEIQEAVTRASQLTRQLLAFSRRQKLEKSVINVEAIVNGTAKMLRRLQCEDIVLQVHVHDGLFTAYVDRGQIEQVLMNLAINARDAMPEGGEIILGVEHKHLEMQDLEVFADGTEMSPGTYVFVSFTDTGVGIKPEIRDKIWDPFFTTKPEFEGTGLGLSTAYGIIKQHGGHITVYSELGVGTTFGIYLPEEKETVGVEDDKKIVSSGWSETIMLVEDDPIVARVGQRLLRDLGYRVITAHTAQEAITQISENAAAIDLLMTDVIMPEMNGGELARLVQQKYPDIKVLFVSGYPPDFLAKRGITLDNALLLQKPFVRAEVASCLRQVLTTA